ERQTFRVGTLVEDPVANLNTGAVDHTAPRWGTTMQPSTGWPDKASLRGEVGLSADDRAKGFKRERERERHEIERWLWCGFRHMVCDDSKGGFQVFEDRKSNTQQCNQPVGFEASHRGQRK